MQSRLYSKANLNKALSLLCTAVGFVGILFGGTKRAMVERIGAKIGILGAALAIPTLIVKLIVLIIFAFNWPYSLILPPILVLAVILMLFIIHTLRKPRYIRELYKNRGGGLLIGLMVCFPLAGEFIVQGEYQFGDAISTMLIFLSGILFIISDIVMIHEVKEGTEQIDIEA